MEKNIYSLIFKWRKVLMGISALWIWMFHCWHPIFTGTVLESFEKGIMQPGFCGVDIFLLLSGMGLVYSIQKSSLPKFYYNRIKRVLIPYVIISVAIGIFVKWPLMDFIKTVTGFYFLRVNIYTFLWFVPAILILYFLFPLYYLLISKAEEKGYFTCLSIIIWFAISLLLKEKMRGDLWGFTNRIPIFLIGIYMGIDSKTRILPWKNIFLPLSICMFIAGKISSSYCINKGYFLILPESDCLLPNILMTLSIVLLLPIVFEKMEEYRSTHFKYPVIRNFFEFFGMISLEFYCVQERLFNLFNDAFTFRFGALTSRMLIFALSALCGLLLFWLSKIVIIAIEAPFSKMQNREV